MGVRELVFYIQRCCRPQSVIPIRLFKGIYKVKHAFLINFDVKLFSDMMAILSVIYFLKC